MLVTHIWHTHNDLVWNNIQTTSGNTLHLVVSMLEDWLAVRPPEAINTAASCCLRWRKPTAWLMQVDEGEAWGLMEALNWVLDLGLSMVEVEMDAKRVVDVFV
ncbi:hypothetical protein ACS0TY_014285 [Phlomoides rotata]